MSSASRAIEVAVAYFQRIFFTALIAGVLGGILASALNISVSVPMILQAEVYEHHSEHNQSDEHASAHDHAAVDTVERNGYTLIAMTVAYVGFALLLSVMAETIGGMTSWRSGLVFGGLGYLVFSLVPALGLPPELPGMPAADLHMRQMWWLTSAACTVAALLISWKVPRLPSYFVAALLIAAPFIVGVPSVEASGSLVPAELHHRFVAATLIINLITWLAMGSALGVLRSTSGNRFKSLEA